MFPSIDLDFDSAGSEFIKSQLSLKWSILLNKQAEENGALTCSFSDFLKADFFVSRKQVNLKK